MFRYINASIAAIITVAVLLVVNIDHEIVELTYYECVDGGGIVEFDIDGYVCHHADRTTVDVVLTY